MGVPQADWVDAVKAIAQELATKMATPPERALDWRLSDKDFLDTPVGQAALSAPMGVLVPASKAATRAAEILHQNGVDPATIWSKLQAKVFPGTGLAEEIPAGKILNPQGQTLKAVYDNPELYSRFPELQNVGTAFKEDLAHPNGWNGTAYGTSQITGGYKSEPDLISLLEHEVQHIVQNKAGWPLGTNPTLIAQELDTKSHVYQDIMRKITQAWDKGGQPEVARALKNQYSEIGRGNISGDWLGEWLYNAKAGEAQARAVDARALLSPEARKAAPPQYTQRVWESVGGGNLPMPEEAYWGISPLQEAIQKAAQLKFPQ
jgi:hypothetical protein